MCATHCGCTTRTGGVVDFLLGLAGIALWKAIKTAGYAVAVAAVLAYRWFGGAPMWGTSAIPAGWPRWHRALARTGIAAVALLGALWPWPTAAALAGLGSLTCLAVWEARRRQAAARAARKPIAAIAAVPHHPAPVLSDMFEGVSR